MIFVSPDNTALPAEAGIFSFMPEHEHRTPSTIEEAQQGYGTFHRAIHASVAPWLEKLRDFQPGEKDWSKLLLC